MKLVMDEKVKHRLIGLAVIISLAAIFAPAMMKKSNQRPESNFSVNVKLPPKPVAPDVVINDEKEVFKTIKVAKVELPSVPEERQLPELVKAERIKSDLVAKPREVAQVEPQLKTQPIKLALNEKAKAKAKKIVKLAAVAPMRKNPVQVVRPKAAPRVAQVAKVSAKPAIQTDVYALQLASFSQLTNAQILVNKLRSRGYKANFATVRSGQGAVYKVLVGHSPRRTDVVRLKSQLASAMQLNGFIVNTRVS